MYDNQKQKNQINKTFVFYSPPQQTNNFLISENLRILRIAANLHFIEATIPKHTLYSFVQLGMSCHRTIYPPKYA